MTPVSRQPIYQGDFTHNHKCEPHGGTQNLKIIRIHHLRTLNVYKSFHLIVVEMFHFGSIAHSVKNAQTCSSPSQLSAGLLTFGVFVAQCCFSHVTEAQGAFAAAVDKQVTVVGVELSRCDHLRQILHVGWFDVHDV